MSDESAPPGQMIDVWVVEAALGRGAFATVYRCHNRDAPRIKAAIKVLAEQPTANGEIRARFVREAEILYGVHHPNIVRVRNVRLDASPPYIEMEFVEGESLAARLKQGPLTLEEALHYTDQLTSAVHYLHEHGVCHRDIKPANLLIRHGTLKLVDFGLATERTTEGITEQGALIGTVEYVPPEWMRPAELDPVSWDLYAIGVVLGEMLTGRTAFKAPTGATSVQAAVQVMMDKQERPHVDPGESVPPPVRRLVRDLTARDRSKRIGTATELRTRLRQVMQTLWGTPTAPNSRPRNLPLPPPAEAPASRLPVFAIAVGVTLAAALATAALLWVVLLRPVPGPPPFEERRAIEVVVLAEVEAALTLDDQRPILVDGTRFVFSEHEIGPVTARWSVGPGCNTVQCPGDECPRWCSQGEEELQIPPGEGPWAMRLPIAPSLPRPLVIETPNVRDPLLVWVADQQAILTDGTATIDVPPGPHTLVLGGPTCAGELDCFTSATCPEGCVVHQMPVIVLPGHTSQALQVDFVPSTPAVAQPRSAPRTAGATTSSRPVTARAFAAWLSDHADWKRDAAIASGQADDNYLAGFDPATAGNVAMVGVSWFAAHAYCASRGGLADVEASPAEWEESTTQPFQEWRTSGGAGAWRRFDGASSPQRDRTASNPFTGLRCAR